MLTHRSSRRGFLKSLVAAGTVTNAYAQSAAVAGFDHVALPMQNTDAMVAFYRRLGFRINETANTVSVYAGSQMINFHRPAHWQDSSFTLRAPAAKPPCGDLCFVWNGTAGALNSWLESVSAKVELGPVDRPGGRQRTGSSTYIRDPDGNLLEFMIYR